MKVKRVFRGVPKGKFYPVAYQPGDVIPAELVSAAKAVDADKEPPEGSLPPKVEPTSVSQRGADGTSGRSVTSKGKGKGKGKGDDEGGTEDSGDADGNSGTEGGSSSEDNAGTEGDGAGDDNAGSEANADDAGSGDPKLAGLG